MSLDVRFLEQPEGIEEHLRHAGYALQRRTRHRRIYAHSTYPRIHLHLLSSGPERQDTVAAMSIEARAGDMQASLKKAHIREYITKRYRTVWYDPITHEFYRSGTNYINHPTGAPSHAGGQGAWRDHHPRDSALSHLRHPV